MFETSEARADSGSSPSSRTTDDRMSYQSWKRCKSEIQIPSTPVVVASQTDSIWYVSLPANELNLGMISSMSHGATISATSCLSVWTFTRKITRDVVSFNKASMLSSIPAYV